MPKVKVGDINIYYELYGKGEPLVNIPGAGGTMDGFYRHIPVYARKYKLVAYDPRGAGRTDAPDIPYTTEMMADDLAGLLDAIGIDSAHIMGASMGGMIAQQFALRYPQRVRSLILACTKFGGPHEIPVDAEILDYWEHPKQLSPEDSIMQGLRLQMSQEFIDKNPDLIKQIITKALESPPPVNPQSGMRQVQAIIGHNTYDRLPEIKAPTLVIQGDADRMSPVGNARILASRIPNAELVILKKMGHAFIIEAFDESNRIMLDFLKRHSTKKA
jgi:pimeloyl-ACP methyl ester carboxylesterase